MPEDLLYCPVLGVSALVFYLRRRVDILGYHASTIEIISVVIGFVSIINFSFKSISLIGF